MNYVTAKLVYDHMRHSMPHAVRSARDVEKQLEKLCDMGLLRRHGFNHKGEKLYSELRQLTSQSTLGFG